MGQQGASQGYYTVALHTFILALDAILGFCIQLKFPNVSPYETAYGTRLMNVFTIELSIYFVSLIVMTTSAARHSVDFEDLMKKVCLLFGTLPLILELFVLIKPFGWFVVSVWIICLVWFVCKYCHSLQTLRNNAVEHLVQALREFRQTLIDGNRRRMIRNDEAGNIELQPQNLNISNDRRSTEHLSEDQIDTSLTELVLSIPDE